MAARTAETYVISDLHVGSGAGDPLEDFFADDQLTAFVGAMHAATTTLVINGDFVDFAQIEPLDASVLPPGLIWDEDTSLLKLDKALAGHPAAFDALSGLVADGGTLQVVVGNHDLDFVWPKTQARLRDALHDTDGRVSFVVGATTVHGVHIDHGYQGGFKWSSQHLDRWRCRWRRCGSGSGRCSCIGGRSRRRVGRRWRGGRIGCGSGRRSLAA